MTKKRMDGLVMTLVAVTSAIGPLSGCASFPLTWRNPRFDSPLPPEPTAAIESADPPRRDVRAAVEEVLERTKDYDFSNSDSNSIPTTTPVTERALASRGPESPPRSSIGAEARDETLWSFQISEHLPAVHNQAFTNTQVVLRDTSPAGPVPALPVIQSVSIRSIPQPDLTTADPITTKTTNEPLDMRAVEELDLVDRIISMLKTRAARSNDFDNEWRLRLVQLAFQRDAEAVEVSPDISQEARSLLTALIRAAVAVRRAVRNPLLIGEEALAGVNELREVLTRRADPVVTAVAFCRKVVTFGVYEEMAAVDFVAGRTTQTIVYSEIRNFQSDRTDDGKFRTRLATRLEVLTADGQSVWQHEEPEIADLCRRRRTDFFIAQRIALPPTLPAGDYVLKVMVEDKLSGRVSETSRPFVISSAISLAKGR